MGGADDTFEPVDVAVPVVPGVTAAVLPGAAAGALPDGAGAPVDGVDVDVDAVPDPPTSTFAPIVACAPASSTAVPTGFS